MSNVDGVYGPRTLAAAEVAKIETEAGVRAALVEARLENQELSLQVEDLADVVYEMKHRLMLGLDADKTVADVLDESGAWLWGRDDYSSEDIEIHAPFTRLEPVRATAKKVLEAVEVAMNKRDWSTAWSDIADMWAEVGEQFGVES